MNQHAQYMIEVTPSFSDINADEWDGLISGGDGSIPNPFVTHAFLYSLEKSQSACVETGWLGQHLILKDQDKRICAALPCYLKNHSQGEYVFDHGWADALERAGGRYYPKLQCSIPFTPATGPRFLASQFTLTASREVLAGGLKQLCAKHEVSSAHITFLPEDDLPALKTEGFLGRVDQQFHWYNQGFERFDNFLETLSSRKRKNIRKERQLAASAEGMEFEWITGSDISEELLDIFFVFYQDTGTRKWGRPYLTREFFTLIVGSMADQILLIMAKREGKYIAGAINFIGDDCLFGRHWGCIESHRALHFEVCYYQAIEFAIAKKLGRVEAGAQGEHKLARGYMPVNTYSAHWISNPDLRRAIEHYLHSEREHVKSETEYLSAHGPFRKDNNTRKNA